MFFGNETQEIENIMIECPWIYKLNTCGYVWIYIYIYMHVDIDIDIYLYIYVYIYIDIDIIIDWHKLYKIQISWVMYKII